MGSGLTFFLDEGLFSTGMADFAHHAIMTGVCFVNNSNLLLVVLRGDGSIGARVFK